MELLRVVSIFVAIFAKYNFVDVFGNNSIVLRVIDPLDLSLHSFFSLLCSFSLGDCVKCLLQIYLGFFEDLLL